MIFTVQIDEKVINDLAVFLGKTSLSEDEVRDMVEETIRAKAAEFVDISLRQKLDLVTSEMIEAAQNRKAEVITAISVQ